MIFDSVIHAPGYRGMSPQLDIALELMQAEDFANAPLGRVEASGGVYYTVMDCALVSQKDAVWERHQNFIDIQWVLAGQERIFAAPVEKVESWGEYDPQRDAAFSSAPAAGTLLELHRENFALFFPWDAHRCCIAATNEKSVRKVVIKIPV